MSYIPNELDYHQYSSYKNMFGGNYFQEFQAGMKLVCIQIRRKLSLFGQCLSRVHDSRMSDYDHHKDSKVK